MPVGWLRLILDRFQVLAGTFSGTFPGNLYIAADGTTTKVKSRAAKFYSDRATREFAKEKNITLSATTHVGQEDFTDFEMQGG